MEKDKTGLCVCVCVAGGVGSAENSTNCSNLHSKSGSLPLTMIRGGSCCGSRSLG